MQKNSFLKNVVSGAQKRFSKIFRNPYSQVNLNFLKLKYYKHLPAGRLRSHELFGKKVFFYSPGELLHGLHEIFIDNIYKQELPQDAVILDCGANIGLSVIYLKQLCPSAKIIAFEPDERNFELLKKNIVSFGFKDVELRKEAVWIENSMLSFSNEASMSSHITNDQTTSKVQVKATRLKDLLNQKIDFLKIDIEGAEYRVICDLGNSLNNVQTMFLEYHGQYQQIPELTEIFNKLNQSGFRYYIKEAATIYQTPFIRKKDPALPYDIQLNIFCIR